MKKLLVFTENFARGGGNKYLIDLVNASSLLFDTIVVASNREGFYIEEKPQFKAKCLFTDISFFTSPIFLSKLGLLTSRHPFVNLIRLIFLFFDPVLMLINMLIFYVFLRKTCPSSVLCSNGGYPASRACLAMVLAARLASVPVILSIVSMPVPRKHILACYEKLVDRLIWHSVNVVIVNAQAITKQLVVLRGMPAEKAKVIYNGLPELLLQPKAPRFGQPLVIGCIARLDVAKGVLNLFNAFRVLLKVYPSIQLVLVGAGNGSAKLAQLIAEYGLDKSVTLTGHFSGDVSKLLSQFDIFAFPSLWEGFPYSILEAMRSGMPIISTSVGGIPEAITDGVEGLLVPAGSVEALSQGLARLIDNQDMRMQLSMNARQRFERDFTLTKMANRTQKILQEFI